MKRHVLVAIDDSPATDAAIDYVADLLRGTKVTVDLVHMLPSDSSRTVPAFAGKPKRAERRFERSRVEGQSALLRAVERLKAAGLDPGAIDDGLLFLEANESPAQGLTARARAIGCDTIVVGRNALSWHRELFHHHIADALIREAAGFAVWVVE